MHAVIRRYTSASALIDAMAQRRQDLENLLTSIPGFVAYQAVRSGDRLTTITVCDSEAATEESTRRAAAWVKDNVGGVSMSAPDVMAGDVFLRFGR